MNSVSKNVYIDRLDDIVNKYNSTHHSTIKMMYDVDVKSNPHIDSSQEINKKGPKFKIGNNARISKYKTVFAKGYTTNWSEEVFVIKSVKTTVLLTYVISHLNVEEIVGTFYQNDCKNQIKKNLELKRYPREKVINYMLNGKVMKIVG